MARGSNQNPEQGERGDKPAKKYRPAYHLILAVLLLNPLSAVAEVVGGRPASCPKRFCGCALSIKLFGRQVPGLNLSTSWLRFPRTHAQPGAVAVRRGHVFQLLHHVSGNTWMVWDANSGGGKTRVHHRSVAGYVFVNPRASNFAEAK